jgi:predicted 3-demethylubiquinone-9 3-methyltransferase (glyoxalase superfamily)
MQKITPYLWFDKQAEEAANYYVSIFENAHILNTTRYDAAMAEVAGLPEGSVGTIEFELDGQRFMALNGGPTFHFTEAVSFLIDVETQEEVDYYWDRLSAGGEEQPCGWLKDKFGLSWQVVPSILGRMITDPDHEAAERATQAMLQMKKLDIAALQAAFDGA